jgi:DNA repair protein RadD
MQLRPYQQNALDRIREAFRNKKHKVMVCSPTGSGKGVMLSSIINSAAAKGSKVLFLVHRTEILFQVSDYMDHYAIRHGIIKAGEVYDPRHNVDLASVQTMVRRIKHKDFGHYDMVVVDEAHHSTAATYVEIIEKYAPKLLIGFTATPCRKSGMGLGAMYNELIIVETMANLVEQGYLVPVRYFAPFEPDLKGVKITAGDYNEKQLSMTMMQGAITANIVEKWKQLGEDRQTVCFTTTVAHSVAVCEKFRSEGIPAEHVDGATDPEERKEILRRYARGEFKILCNCAVFTEGVDIPSISCVIMARPTKSIVMYLQCVGRGMRLAEGKTDMILLDMAGVYWEHGPITEITNWTLNEKTKMASEKNEKRKERNSRPITCLSCHSVYTGQLKCPRCGTIPVKERYGQDVEEIDAVLGEIVYKGGTGKEKSKKSKTFTMEEKQSWFSQLVQHGRNKGYKDGWAANQYREKFGVWPNSLSKTPKPITSTVQDWIMYQNIKRAKAKTHVPTHAGLPV